MNSTRDLTPEQVKTLLLINHTFSGLSLIGGLIIIVLFLKTRNQWTSTGKLIICLVFSNLVHSINNLLPLVSSDYYEMCKIDGPLRIFSTLSSFYWATMISLLAFRAMRSTNFNPNNSSGFALGFIGPLLIGLIPVFNFDTLRYHNQGLNCDISSKYTSWETVWQITFLIGPMMLGFLLTTYYSRKVVNFLKGLEKTLGIKTWHFLAHPIGLLVAWTPDIIFRIMYVCGGYYVWFDALNIAFSSSAGLINAVIYGWQSINASKAASNSEKNFQLSIGMKDSIFGKPSLLPSEVENPSSLSEMRSSKVLIL